jgi:hypothetical protein
MFYCARCDMEWEPGTPFCPKCRNMGVPKGAAKEILKNRDTLIKELCSLVDDQGRERMKSLLFEMQDLFNHTFSRERIDHITELEYEHFFRTLKERCKYGIPYEASKRVLDRTKVNIKYFLYGDDPIESRINKVLQHGSSMKFPMKIEGMQRSATVLLHLMDPEKYCIWNDRTQDVLFDYLGKNRIEVSWDMYSWNLKNQKEIANELDIDLFYLDNLLKTVGDK